MTQAPERIWACPDDDQWLAGNWDLARDGLPLEQEYIRADLSRPRVKPLVWECRGNCRKEDYKGWMEESNTVLEGGYFIQFCPKGYFTLYSTFGRSQDGFETPDDAKAAAQADYERRIMEALE